jgi:heat shock protein HslJ
MVYDSMRPLCAALAAIVAPLLIVACVTPTGSSAVGPPLLGTEWVLVEFVSSDDAIGTIRPSGDEAFTLLLKPDGSAAMQLSCNRGFGGWTSPDAKAQRGSIEIKGVGSTMAACPPGAITRLPADFEHLRSFVIEDGRLHLNLMMDGGNYVWKPKN